MSTATSKTRIAFDRTGQVAPQIVEYLRERILALELRLTKNGDAATGIGRRSKQASE